MQRAQGIHSREREREANLAARWAAGLWRGEQLRAETGERYTLIYQGRPGGSAGPDFRDAVLALPDGTRLYGDVELHLRASGWRAHGHAADVRYNDVVLHVVLRQGVVPVERTTLLASGGRAPLVVLGTLPSCESQMHESAWPCVDFASQKAPHAVRALLRMAGHARFEQRAAVLRAELDAAMRAPPTHQPPGVDAAALWDAPSRVLWCALAEGLGYGRDRATLRSLGIRLARGEPPAALRERYLTLPRVERMRLRGLLHWHERWRQRGPWQALRPLLYQGDARAAARDLCATLVVGEGLVAPGRAAILVTNVVLPFAAAWSAALGEPSLAERALAVYDALPGLPSNQITREMTQQLGLPRLPSGAAAQQGLQHIWASTCREKQCGRCILGGLAP